MANSLVTINFDLSLVNKVDSSDIERLISGGRGGTDGRTRVSVVYEPGTLENDASRKQLYFNYMKFLSSLALNISKLPEHVQTRDTRQTLALLEMGFLPIICEPTFLEGRYRTEENMKKLVASGLKLYDVRPMSFTVEEIQSNIGLTDTLVHRNDAAKLVGKAPHTVKVRDVWEVLNLC